MDFVTFVAELLIEDDAVVAFAGVSLIPVETGEPALSGALEFGGSIAVFVPRKFEYHDAAENLAHRRHRPRKACRVIIFITFPENFSLRQLDFPL